MPRFLGAAAGLLAALGVAPVFAGAPGGAAAVKFEGGFPVTSRKAVYRLDEVKVGDRGVGYTVFTGAEVKPFQVEVLGIMRGMLGPRQDVILARLTGPEIEFTGVISGMSGSPVYIDGRLVGAVSYRFGSFSKEPIAGITPIEAMLDIYRDQQIAPKRKTRVAGGPVPYTRSRELLAPLPIPPRPVVRGPNDPQPIETPIFLAGFTPDAAKALQERFAEAGMMAVVGAGGDGEASVASPRATGKAHPNAPAIAGGGKAAPIAPGAPIAAILMRGDLNVAGTGTVTYIEDDVVLAFGHPFFGYGHVAFPMATASILNTLASLAGSYKQAATAVEVGAIQHDRLTAIAGSLGQVVPMVPVRIDLRPDHLPEGAAPVRTEVEIVDHEIWLPVMISSALASSASGRLADEAGGTMDVVARFKVGDRTLELTDTYSTTAPLKPSQIAAQDVATIAAIISRNGIADAPIERIEVQLRTKPEVELAWLDEVRPHRLDVAAGETLALTAFVRPYRGKVERVPLEVQIPKDAEPGELELVVGGAVELDGRDRDVWGDPVPSDLDDLLGLLAERRPGRGIYARVYQKRPGLRADSERFPSLPASMRLTMGESFGAHKKVVKEAPGPETRVDYPGVLVGSKTIKLRVVR